VTPVRVAFVEWPEGLVAAGGQWDQLKNSVSAARPDILLTNELPFGPWLADAENFSRDAAQRSIEAHEQGLAALIGLALPAVISTRPVWNGARLANEAFVLENGSVRALHRKQYFPNEAGWFESNWYAGDSSGFHPAEIAGINVGALICTEAMFNERARDYKKHNVALIVIPRASGMNLESWKIAGAMASLVSGAYMASSNRVGTSAGGTRFGGGGYAYAPEGKLLAVTSAAVPLQVFELDPHVSAAAQRDYPCYVPELE
jgi:N-carbamoylputrescine amidase